MTTPNDQPDRIRITEDDVASPEVDRRVEEMEQAQKVALVRVVGSAPTGGSATTRAILTLVIGGAVGGVLSFVLCKLFLEILPTKTLAAESSFFNNMTFSFMLALGIGACVALADVVMNRSWAKLGQVALIAIPAAIGAALVLGLFTHLFYSTGIQWLVDSAIEKVYAGDLAESDADSWIMLRLHPLRGVAWMFVGISAGIAAGAAARSWKRLGLAALGGAVGGFLGGFIFDFIAQSDESEWIAQLVGIVLLGTLVGLATGLVEQASKNRWIEIVSGGLAGKQFILYKTEIALGSAPSADITLIKDPTIAPIAAVMRVRGNRCEFQAVPGMEGLAVNGVPAQYAELNDMDVVTVGATQIRYREKSGSSKTPGALRS